MELVYKNEKRLFGLMLVFSSLAWTGLLIGATGGVLLYLAVISLLYYLAQSALLSYLRGTAVRITYQQFPDLKARIDICCERLGLEEMPDAYLLPAGGALRAGAVRCLGRRCIVLPAELVDALEERPDAINFHIGHEIARIKRRHWRWSALLMPGALAPLLGAAYARARAYTCDRHGFHACDDLDSAQLGLATLAAGRRWRQLSASSYAAQGGDAAGFWMSFHELVGDRPWLVKRMAAVCSLAQGVEAAPAARSKLAYLLALAVPRVGGGAAGVLLLAALAAFAVPALGEAGERERMARAVGVGEEATAAVDRYFYVHGRPPANLREAGFALDDPSHAVVDVQVDGEAGVVRVFPAAYAYRGKAIAFTPALDKNRKVAWRCAGEDIPARLLPPACRS